MVMSIDRFILLTAKLEYQAANRPRSYKTRVLILAALGYLYVFLVLVLSLSILYVLLLLLRYFIGHASFASLRLIEGIIPLGLFILIVFRSLWVRIPEPEGLELQRYQALTLFNTIGVLCRRFNISSFDKVLIGDDFNASVVQVPRLGVFGWQKNILMLGLPLMTSLSSEEFQAVLAHELGHISKSHSRFGGWIYRLNKTWSQLFERLEQQHQNGAFVFQLFFNWYAPFFAAYTFALRKADEYEADRRAAEVVSARSLADSLTRISMIEVYYRKQEQEKEIQLDAKLLLKEALLQKNDPFDTHPSLAFRLRALGQEPRIPDRVQQDAADRFLGRNVIALAKAIKM